MEVNMLKGIGVQIRTLRKQKGISLNELASKVGVSRGYLANLETGKTDSIQISVLEQLQNELKILPDELVKKLAEENEFDLKLKRINLLLKELHNQDPSETEFLFQMIEKRYELFYKKTVGNN
jgi:transcriptional regulator with XRE-family HTH domain